MKSDDTVRIVVDGREFSGWTGASIEMSVDNVADGFSVSAAYDPEKPELRQSVKPFGYQRVQVYIGDDLYLTGTVDKVDTSTDASGRVATIQGRSLTAPLIDCSIDGDLEIEKLTFAAIARKVCRPFGIVVVANVDTPALELSRATYGEKAFDFLNGIASARGLLLNSSYRGELKINSGKALIGLPVVERIVEGEGNFLSARVTFDGTRRYGVYKTASQFAGSADIPGEARDASIKVYRPLLAVADDADADPNVTASRLRTQAMVESFGVSVTLSGWRHSDGGRWHEREAVTLKAPGAMLPTECTYIVAGVRLSLDESSGMTTELSLVLPETYSGTMPKETPWA